MTTLATDLYLLVAAYGLAVAVSYAGLPVLGQGAFVAVGAFGTSQLASHGVPLGVAVITAVAMAAVAGYLVGFAAARLAGAQLALATWALAWLAYTALVVFPRLSGGAQGLTRATPAHLVSPSLGLDIALQPWVHVLIAAVIGVALACGAHRRPAGRRDRDAWPRCATSPATRTHHGDHRCRHRRRHSSARCHHVGRAVAAAARRRIVVRRRARARRRGPRPARGGGSRAVRAQRQRQVHGPSGG